MAQTHIEQEPKFEAAEGIEVPDLADVLPGGSVTSATARMRAVYYDTADRALQRRGVTLRRRSGGSDAGWQLKIPADDAMLEARVDSDSARVPRELAALTRGICLGQPLAATARLNTERTTYGVRDPSDQLVGEVADDVVHATPLLSGRDPTDWREVGVELGPSGDDKALKALRRRLERAGFGPSAFASKYVRAVGEPPARERLPRLAGLVDDYLQEQYSVLGEDDARLRLGENRVHGMRVAVRRMRSTIRVFGELFDDEASAALDSDLRWMAELLGRARDLDIVRERLAHRVGDLPAALAVEQVAADVESTLARERVDAGAALDAAMNGRRYLSLLKRIEGWRTQPPRTGIDPKPSAVAAYVDRAGKTARTRLRAALASGVDDDFHRARKAAKRHRYAAELAAPRLGDQATGVVAAATELQDRLGELQDTVTSRAVLLDLGSRGGAASRRSGFAFGLMYGHEQHAADEIRGRVAERYG